MKKRYIALLFVGLAAAIFLPLLGKIAPKGAQAVRDFRDGLMGIPRMR